MQQRQRLASQPWLVSRQMGALQCSVTLTLPLLLCAVLELSVCSALLFPPPPPRATSLSGPPSGLILAEGSTASAGCSRSDIGRDLLTADLHRYEQQPLLTPSGAPPSSSLLALVLPIAVSPAAPQAIPCAPIATIAAQLRRSHSPSHSQQPLLNHVGSHTPGAPQW